MATYLADRVIVFEGKPAVAATATPYAFYVLLYATLLTLNVLLSLDHNPSSLE
jgi:translation initiation factor RLI1